MQSSTHALFTTVLAGLQHGLKPRGSLGDINDELGKNEGFSKELFSNDK